MKGLNGAKLPKTVRVACYDIDIVVWHPHAANAQRRYGEFSSQEMLLRVDTNNDRFNVLNTLLHEINHAIYWAYGMDDEDKEERIVDNMTTAWTQIYRDNPGLLEFIREVTHGCSNLRAESAMPWRTPMDPNGW